MCDLSVAIIRDAQNTNIEKLCYQIVNKQTYNLIMNLLVLFPRGIDDIIMTYAEFIVVDFNQDLNKIIDINVIITEIEEIVFKPRTFCQIKFNTGNYHMIVYNYIFDPSYRYSEEPTENMYYIHGDGEEREFIVYTQHLQSQRVTLLRKGQNDHKIHIIKEKLIMVDYCNHKMMNLEIPDSIMKIISDHATGNSCYYYGVYSSYKRHPEIGCDTVIKIKKDDLMDDELYEYLYKQIYVTFRALFKKVTTYISPL